MCSSDLINKYLTAIRLRILELSLLQSDPLVGQIEVDESYFGARRGYNGLVDFGYKKHFRVHHSKNEFARGNSHN